MPYPQRWTEDSASAWRWSVQPHSRLQSSQVIGHILLSIIANMFLVLFITDIENEKSTRVFSSGITNLPWVSAHSLTSILNYLVRHNECTRLKPSYYYWRWLTNWQVTFPHACLRAEQMWSPSWPAIYMLIQYLSDWSVSVYYLSAVYLAPSFISMNAWYTTEM